MSATMPRRILVVEDDPAREQRIRSWLPADFRPVVATSAGAAIGILKRDGGAVYSAILLDHDLQSRRASDRDKLLNGEDVAEAITTYVDRGVRILIHSMNPTRRGSMATRLRQAGFTVEVIPMQELSAERLVAWLDEIRQENGD